MDWSWLALLVCPLMMLPMMLLMMRGNHQQDTADHLEHKGGTAELDELKKQNTLLRKQLQQLKNKN